MTRFETIRSILLKDWDPLSISFNTLLAGEYDIYIPAILNLIERKCTAEEIKSFLLALEEDWGLTPDLHSISLSANNIIDAVQSGDKGY